VTTFRLTLRFADSMRGGDLFKGIAEDNRRQEKFRQDLLAAEFLLRWRFPTA